VVQEQEPVQEQALTAQVLVQVPEQAVLALVVQEPALELVAQAQELVAELALVDQVLVQMAVQEPEPVVVQGLEPAVVQELQTLNRNFK
jgi:hypothetical protein